MFSLKLHFYYKENSISNFYRHQLLYLFHQGLIKLKVFFTIEYKKYNNYKVNVFNSLTLDEQMSTLGLIASSLKKESILTIFSLSKKKVDSLLKDIEFIEKINLIYDDFKSIQFKIIIKKQMLSNKYEKIVQEFIEKIELFQKEYSSFKVENLEIKSYQKGGKIDLLTFTLIYKRTEFRVQISQVNFKLYSYIYDKSNSILKDRIYSINDFSRIFNFIQEDYFE